MGRKLKLDRRAILDICRMYRQGHSAVEIGHKHGVSHQTVLDYLRRAGQPVRRAGNWPHDLQGQMAFMYASGASLHEVAETFGRSVSDVRERLRIAGVKIRRRGRPVAV